MIRRRRFPIVTYPENPDSWSESLTPVEGFWHAVGPVSDGQAWSVHLNTVYKAIGEACIAGRYDRADPNNRWIQIAFEFHKVQDLRMWERIRFLHMLTGLMDGKPGFTGECTILIYDSALNLIKKDFGTLPGGGYESKNWNLRSDFVLVRGESIEAVLSNVTRIIFQFWIPYDTAVNGPWGQISCIDQIYFSSEVALSTINILSSPTGKHYTINGTSGYTPAQYQLTPDAQYKIEMDATDFKQWENGDTNPVRYIILDVAEIVTITAYYEGGEPPPPPPPPPIEIPWEVVGIVILSAIYLTIKM